MKHDDDDVLMVCHPADAMEFISENKDIHDAIVTTTLVDKGEVYVVKKDDFLNWLKEEDA